jgi:hypothetical protein
VNRLEAAQLAQRVVDNWPGLSLDAWADVFLDCEHDVATAVLKRMRDSFTSAPSIPDFRVQYKAEIDRRERARDDFGGRPRACEQCSGGGVDGEEYLIIGGPEAEANGTARVYAYPLPCRCTAGQRLPKMRPHIEGEHRWSPTRPPEPPTDPKLLAVARVMQEELRT